MASVPVKALEQEPIQRLPAGSHGIPAEVVALNQRERLISAIAEVCAEKGYAEIAVADVVRRAGVSTATFYKRFSGKRDCMLAAHEELSERLLEEVDRVCAAASDWEGGVRAAIANVLGLLAADAPTARLLTVEILALGPEGEDLDGEQPRRRRVGREQPEHVGDCGPYSALPVRRGGADPVDLLEQPFGKLLMGGQHAVAFAAEALVEGGGGDPGAPDDVGDGDLGVALLRADLRDRRDQPFALVEGNDLGRDAVGTGRQSLDRLLLERLHRNACHDSERS